jgi:hypothetical protein
MDDKYNRYLCSREWSLKKRQVKSRCNGVCERCKDNLMQHVHHLTYARKYNEKLDDLQGVCKACHDFIHGISDFDPKEFADKAKEVASKIISAIASEASEAEQADILGATINFHRWRQGITTKGRPSRFDHIWQSEFCVNQQAGA